jgi:hypothetical protein
VSDALRPTGLGSGIDKDHADYFRFAEVAVCLKFIAFLNIGSLI